MYPVNEICVAGQIVKLLRKGNVGNMFSYVKSHLYNHRASLCRVHSTKILFKMAFHREASCPLHYFFIFANDLESEFPKGIKAALCADVSVTWCKEE